MASGKTINHIARVRPVNSLRAINQADDTPKTKDPSATSRASHRVFQNNPGNRLLHRPVHCAGASCKLLTITNNKGMAANNTTIPVVGGSKLGLYTIIRACPHPLSDR